MVGEKIEKMKMPRRERMEELKFLKYKRSKWEGHRRRKVGLYERRCTGVFGVLGLTAYHRFPPLFLGAPAQPLHPALRLRKKRIPKHNLKSKHTQPLQKTLVTSGGWHRHSLDTRAQIHHTLHTRNTHSTRRKHTERAHNT